MSGFREQGTASSPPSTTWQPMVLESRRGCQRAARARVCISLVGERFCKSALPLLRHSNGSRRPRGGTRNASSLMPHRLNCYRLPVPDPVSGYWVRSQPSRARTACPREIGRCNPGARRGPANAPTHTPAAPPRPHPAHSRPRTQKNRHPPAPSVPRPFPHPTPRTPHLLPTSAPFLPNNPPQSRNFANHLERHAHTCYPRPREEPTLRPGNPTPKRVSPGVGASFRSVENWLATSH